MKDGVVLFLVCAVAIGAIGLWIANGNPMEVLRTHSLSDQSSATSPVPETSAKPATAASAAKGRPGKQPAGKTAIAPAATDIPVVAAAPASVVVAPPTEPQPAAARNPSHFPSAEQIPIGLERASIADRFGRPSLETTTTTESGHFLETLVYAKDSGRAVTVIRVEDGKVRSVYTR